MKKKHQQCIVGIAISENKDIENIIKEKIADYKKTIQVNEENIISYR